MEFFTVVTVIGWEKARAKVTIQHNQFAAGLSRFGPAGTPSRPAPTLPCTYFVFGLSNSGNVGAGQPQSNSL